tara:strand:+ start:356 stop:979 length:624 start_codon:yes stop_codon:yes gene_type:complete
MNQLPDNIREHARQYFASRPLSSDDKTRICLFLQSVKSTNAAILSKIEFQPFEWMPYKYLHTQYYKDIEQSTLLAKATEWSFNPMLYMEATQINLSLWQAADINKFLTGAFEPNRTLYEYLALSHAFMSELRILSLLPPDFDLAERFIHCLHEIDLENGRQIQTQVRMLKDMKIDLSEEEKQQIVDDMRVVVSQAFDALLYSIVQSD